MNHRPGARLSAGSQTVLPTVRFSPATTVEFTPAANNVATTPRATRGGPEGPPYTRTTLRSCNPDRLEARHMLSRTISRRGRGARRELWVDVSAGSAISAYLRP